MNKLIKTFSEIGKKDATIAGGKGASLGEMTKAKFPIPPGFVITAQAFDRFLEETDLAQEIGAALKKIKKDDINSVQSASEKIRDMISDAEFPKDIAFEIDRAHKKMKAGLVAVRSSATAEDSSIASWAGELESYLDVTIINLLDSVKKCWSSLFTPRAIFYRYEKNLRDQKVSVAVVVQKMVQSEVSGIVFTVHPVTKDRNQMVIEAGWGLGESIVGGMITPDAYVIEKSKIKSQNFICDKNISCQNIMITRGKNGCKENKVPKSLSEKQKLSDETIFDLARICLEIENHYKKPQDIEWAMEKGKIYIVQSRPITTL